MAQISLFSSLFSWLPRRQAPSAAAAAALPMPAPSAARTDPAIAWGAKVPDAFKRKTIALCRRLEMEPDHLMAIMAFETGRSFDPAVTNRAGSGATGLIQFMPATAKALGTTTARLATMSALEQLDYVEKYLAPYAGRMGDLDSAYMAVLYPRAVGREPGHVLFRKGSVAYKLNRGLDANGDGRVTKAEAAARVRALLAEGLRPGLIG
ncbi:transglycosylase SLT domain-containing protein [Hoeflea sp. BAL378]|uniref:transglycosylase SLT domain-containing protein n=1 Tax=Hoeflea sp. BAL378 TaxID=1547437 RepID=UPI0009DD1700|nr:transglycosylase SLT domain-containing protein [Hoeflea sp. BAL378]